MLTLPVCVCVLQEKNSALTQENQSQREQYERCLDEVRPLGHQGALSSGATADWPSFSFYFTSCVLLKKLYNKA